MDYLQIANSWPVWLCAGACVAIIVVQAVAFAKLCYKNAPLVGAGYDIYAMANSWLTMALNGCGWLLVVVLLTPRMESLRQKVGGGDEVWLGLITCSASIGLFGYMASQYYNKIVVDPAQAWSCIAGTVVMVACVKFSKKMPWLKEYGLGIAIVIGIVVGALVR